MPSPLVSVSNVTIKYGGFTAVDGCSFDVKGGEIFGLLGPNGSGKSSIIEVIAGLNRNYSGTVLVEGKDLRGARDWNSRFGLVPQEYSFYHDFTVADNLRIFGRLQGYSGQEARRQAEEALARFNLSPYKNKIAGNLSGGYKRLLNIAIASLHNPQLLILDEPTVGIDVNFRKSVWDVLYALRKQGVTVMITTHYMEEAQLLCDRLALISNGQLRIVDTPAKIIEKYGGKPYILLRVDKPDKLESALRQLPTVECRRVGGDSFEVYCAPGALTVLITKLDNFLESNRINIIEEHVYEPTLNEVFLNYFQQTLELK